MESDYVFSCGYDISLTVPFATETAELIALVANHDCANYSLLLTLVLDHPTRDNIVGYTGADQSAKGCIDLDDEFNDTIACEFELTPDSDNFGLLFQGGLNPVFYSTEWVSAEPETNDFFEWLLSLFS